MPTALDNGQRSPRKLLRAVIAGCSDASPQRFSDDTCGRAACYRALRNVVLVMRPV